MLIYRILRSIWWRSPEPVLTARAQRNRGYFNLFLNIHFSPDAEQNSPFQHLSPPRNFAARRRVLSKYLIDQHFNALARLLEGKRFVTPFPNVALAFEAGNYACICLFGLCNNR